MQKHGSPYCRLTRTRLHYSMTFKVQPVSQRACLCPHYHLSPMADNHPLAWIIYQQVGLVPGISTQSTLGVETGDLHGITLCR